MYGIIVDTMTRLFPLLLILGLSLSLTVAQTAGKPASKPMASTTKTRDHFEIEGIRLGMSVQEAVAVAKKSGVPRVTHENGETVLNFKSRDLDFAGLMFHRGGDLYRFEAHSRAVPSGAKSNMAGGTAYRNAVQAFGTSNETDGTTEAHWKNADGSTASYYDMDDVLEVLANK